MTRERANWPPRPLIRPSDLIPLLQMPPRVAKRKSVGPHRGSQAKKAKAEGRVRNVSRQAVRDPGIPNAWPFKEEELALLEARRARAVEEKERKKSEKKMRVSEGKK